MYANGRMYRNLKSWRWYDWNCRHYFVKWEFFMNVLHKIFFLLNCSNNIEHESRFKTDILLSYIIIITYWTDLHRSIESAAAQSTFEDISFVIWIIVYRCNVHSIVNNWEEVCEVSYTQPCLTQNTGGTNYKTIKYKFNLSIKNLKMFTFATFKVQTLFSEYYTQFWFTYGHHTYSSTAVCRII